MNYAQWKMLLKKLCWFPSFFIHFHRSCAVRVREIVACDEMKQVRTMKSIKKLPELSFFSRFVSITINAYIMCHAVEDGGALMKRLEENGWEIGHKHRNVFIKDVQSSCTYSAQLFCWVNLLRFNKLGGKDVIIKSWSYFRYRYRFFLFLWCAWTRSALLRFSHILKTRHAIGLSSFRTSMVVHTGFVDFVVQHHSRQQMRQSHHQH